MKISFLSVCFFSFDEINSNFVDYGNVLHESVAIPANTYASYTATENCYVVLTLTAYGNTGGRATIAGIIVAEAVYAAGSAIPLRCRFVVPLKKGETISIYSPEGYASWYSVHGIS